MNHPITSVLLMGLTVLSGAAAYRAARRLRRPDETGPMTGQHVLVAGIGAASAGLFLYRWLGLHGRWQPLTAHLDGLLLMATLLAGAALFFQLRSRLVGLAAFALPLLTLVLAWAICAAAWTYRPFQLENLARLWLAVHLAGVYLGTASAAIAAGAGAMFLYVQHRLKQTTNPRGIGQLTSLERLETLIVRYATLGFALLTLGLVAGLVILAEKGPVGDLEWWYSPKIALATAAWLVYALLMNVRHARHFRGSRAAWLSIAGLVLLLATYGLVTALASPREARAEAVGRWPLVAGPSGRGDCRLSADCHFPNDTGRAPHVGRAAAKGAPPVSHRATHLALRGKLWHPTGANSQPPIANGQPPSTIHPCPEVS